MRNKLTNRNIYIPLLLDVDMNIQEKKCLRCSHEWLPRTKNNPKKCPKCGTYNYGTKRRAETDENTKSIKAFNSDKEKLK